MTTTAFAPLLALLQPRYDARGLAQVTAAAELASQVHARQKRPDGLPYVTHVVEVAELVATWCPEAHPDVLIAALLHDSVEDQADQLAALAATGEPPAPSGDTRARALDYLETRFGVHVQRRVAWLSNPDFDAMMEGRVEGLDDEELRAVKAGLYAEHVSEAVHSDSWVAAIKLADFSTNAWRLSNVHDPERRARLREKYRPVMALFIKLLKGVKPGHPLAHSADALRAEIDAVWRRDYAG